MSDGKSDEGLPEGWKVRVTVRKDGRKDKFYTDPVHGYRFRSIKEVHRYIETGEVGSRQLKFKDSPLDKAAEDDLLASAKTLNFSPDGLMNGNSPSLTVHKVDPITTVHPEIQHEEIDPSLEVASPETKLEVTNGLRKKSAANKKGRQLPLRASRRAPVRHTLLQETTPVRSPPKRKDPATPVGVQSSISKLKKGADSDDDNDAAEIAPSVKQCLEMVQSLPGIEDDPEFDFTIVASRLFVKKIYRVMFVSLREEKRLKWLREYAKAGVTAD